MLLAGYLVYAVRAARKVTPDGHGVGVWFGIAAAACWSAEISVGGPVLLDTPSEKAIAAAFVVAAMGFTGAAGLAVGTRTREAGSVWHAGLSAGMIRGALVYVFAVTTTMATLPALRERADYQAQFARSGLSTMPDFLVNDILRGDRSSSGHQRRAPGVGAVAGRIVLPIRLRAAPRPPSP